MMLLNIRNKVGIDVCSEVVNSYLALSNRNLTLLMDYTGKLRVTKTLEKISRNKAMSEEIKNYRKT